MSWVRVPSSASSDESPARTDYPAAERTEGAQRRRDCVSATGAALTAGSLAATCRAPPLQVGGTVEGPRPPRFRSLKAAEKEDGLHASFDGRRQGLPFDPERPPCEGSERRKASPRAFRRSGCSTTRRIASRRSRSRSRNTRPSVRIPRASSFCKATRSPASRQWSSDTSATPSWRRSARAEGTPPTTILAPSHECERRGRGDVPASVDSSHGR